MVRDELVRMRSIKDILTRNREYVISYYSVGMMSNVYQIGTFSFKVTDKELKKIHYTPQSYGYVMHLDILKRHYRALPNGNINLKTITHSIDGKKP